MASRRHDDVQLALRMDLRRMPKGRGGWRPKAGRKGCGRVSHAARPALSRHHPIHVTLRTAPEASVLRRRRVYQIIRRCIAASHGEQFRVCEFSIMGNHVHLIVEATDAQALTRGVQRLTTRMALRINRCLGRHGKVFADRFHSRPMTSPRQVRSGLLYVLQNLKHHAPGRDVAFDSKSSAASFGGWAEALPRDAAWMREALAEERATAPPTTWLLATGWRRHGLIGLDEAPALHRR